MGTPSSENFGKLAHYPRGAGFFGLLRWHFRWGTRPDLDPDKVGTPWTADSFSAASYELGNVVEAVEPKTVDGWLNNETRPYPTKLRTIVAVLFRDSLAYEAWRAELQRAHSDIPARGRVRQDSRTTDAEETQRPLVGGNRPQTDQASIAATAEQDTVVIIDKLAQHFVGRSSDIEAIDSFATARMDGDSRGLMVITAPPGIGKSALAAHWCKHAGKAANRRIVRHFCSMSNGSEQTKPEVIYEHLHKQIADFYGQPIGAARHMDALTHLLCKSPPDGQELVVWLDGIDEANGTVDCFVPYASGLEEKLGERVCIIISARAEPKTTPAYLAPWLVGKRAETHKPDPHCLEKLLQVDVKRLIEELFAVNDLNAPQGLAERIFMASEGGWPLFVRNMIESTIEALREGRAIDLDKFPESLQEYALDEIERLEALTDWRDLHPIFIFLTIAKQAVSRADLEIILGMKIFPKTFPSQLRRWLNVVEDRGGRNSQMLSFAHPLLARVFGQHLGDRQEDAEKEFVEAITPLSYGSWPQYASRYLPWHLLEMGHIDDAVRQLTNIEFITSRFAALGADSCLTAMKADWMVWYGTVQRAKQKTTGSQQHTMRHLRFWNNYSDQLSRAAAEGFDRSWLQMMNDVGLADTPTDAMLESPLPRTLPESLVAMSGHKGSVNGAGILPNGAGFLSWSEDRTLRLWGAAGEPGAVMRGHEDRVRGALSSPYGTGFLSWSDDGTLRLWGADGEPDAVMRGHVDRVGGALSLPDGTGFLSWSDDGTLRLWGTGGESGAVMRGHEGSVYGALSLPDGTGFLSWSDDGTLRLWGAAGEPGAVMRGHIGGIPGVGALPDSVGFLSWGYDGTLCLWGAASKRDVVPYDDVTTVSPAFATLGWPAVLLLSCRFGRTQVLPNRMGFLFWGLDSTLQLWKSFGELGAVMRGHEFAVNGALILADSAGFLSWSYEGTLRLWGADGEPHAVMRGHEDMVYGALCLHDGAGFLSWSCDGTLRLWGADGEPGAVLRGHEKQVTGALSLPDGTGFLSWGDDGTLRLWGTGGESGAVMRGHRNVVNGALILPDGAGFLSWGFDGTLCMWGATGQPGPILSGHMHSVDGALTLPDGAGFLSWSVEGKLRLWSTAGEKRSVLQGHRSRIDGALLLPDNAGFFSWSGDGSLRLWSLAGEPGPVMRGHTGYVRGALVLPDGRGFLSWGVDGTLRIWDWRGKLANLWLSPCRIITSVELYGKRDHYLVVFGGHVGIVHLPFSC
jgi:WD40 repeat protein